MKRIVLLRHGESLWNKENRFTGWTDVDLSDKGIAEACKAGDMLKEAGFSFEAAYTSYLKRAVKTLNCVLDRLNEDWIPVEKSWRLNEKHYGILQGLNKRETADKYGEEQVHIWRRSYGVSPEPVKEDDPRYPRNDTRYAFYRLFDVASHISSFHRLTKEEKPLSQLIVSISPSKSFFPELLILSAKLTYL